MLAALQRNLLNAQSPSEEILRLCISDKTLIDASRLSASNSPAGLPLKRHTACLCMLEDVCKDKRLIKARFEEACEERRKNPPKPSQNNHAHSNGFPAPLQDMLEEPHEPTPKGIGYAELTVRHLRPAYS